MKKCLFLIVPLTLIASSCSNVNSAESSFSNEQSTSEETPFMNLSWAIKHYFDNDYIVSNIRYLDKPYSSNGKITEAENYPIVINKLDELYYRFRVEGDEAVTDLDSIIIHVDISNGVKNNSLSMIYSAKGATLFFEYGENRENRVDLITYDTADNYFGAKQLFDSLFFR